ncbi:hypothetical protein COB55_03765 [Candidatus Wolfebacteria bacterium]|nr:MAG: hypothetical protein COB55_03765 [Candidatus Wolfebacteria bacterium]
MKVFDEEIKELTIKCREHFNIENTFFWSNDRPIVELLIYVRDFQKWGELLEEYNTEQLEKYFIEWLKWKYPQYLKNKKVCFVLSYDTHDHDSDVEFNFDENGNYTEVIYNLNNLK